VTPLLGRILGGRYELLEKTGGGGMAVVYKAKCHLLKRYVAVKILRSDLVENEEFVERFQKESQSVASLSHPNIVNLFDVGVENDTHYIVMEFVDGKTLKDYIKEKGRLSPEETVDIALQICAGLQHAHENNIVHRDIKPQNILISKEGIAKVADFGIARAVTSATITMAGSGVIGSVHYFSPEQARGGHVDKKTDIYSLGIVLYEMVTGVLPFEGDSPVSVALKHLQEKVRPPGEINPDIPKSIQYIIERAIEKDLEKRYQDISEMLHDLKLALKNPDGNYIKRFSEVEQATMVVPAIQNSTERFKTEKFKNLRHSNEKKEKKNKGWGLAAFSIIAVIAVLVSLFIILKGVYYQNFLNKNAQVPNIEGFDEETARNILKKNGLDLHIEEWVYNDIVPEGKVISQNPKEGTQVKTNTLVSVIMSNGVEMVPVPLVINKPQRSAEIELGNKGLQVKEIKYVVSEIPSGYVVEQEPPAFTDVPKGTEVRLVISKGPEDNMVKVEKYIGLTEAIAEKMLKNADLEKGVVIREYNSDVKAGIIFRQSPLPGTNVEQGRKVDLWVSLGEEPLGKNKITISLGDAKNKVQVQIIRISDNKIVYDKIHDPSKGNIEVIIEDKGVQNYSIWIDEEYITTKTLEFTNKEGGDE